MGKRNPRTTRLIVIVVAIVVIAAGLTTYYVLTRPTCGTISGDPLVFDQPETPDSLDPHVTFSTPGWGIVQQIYQSLVNYNGSSYTTFVPVLAKSWTPTTAFNYTFALRQDVHFSNGDPFNAYVMWYSLNRALVMGQAGSFILQENFWLPGLNYYSDANDSANATAWMLNNLNTFNYTTPSTSQIAVMSAANQSFQVIDKYTIQLNMGTGYLDYTPYTVAYSFLLPSIAGPIASAVDPIIIGKNGGVIQDKNAWMGSNMLGTGQYILSSYSTSGYQLTKDPNYWGKAAAAAEPWNNMIQPAKAGIQVKFQNSATVAVSDVKTGAVAGVSFAYVGPTQVDALKGAGCVNVVALDTVYGSTAGGWWIYMNQTQDPFTDIHVRAAVVHAINYDEIISKAFNGYAQRWVGPVPPGYPHYNPNGLQPYSYDLALAMQEMNQSRWPLQAGGGGGYPGTVKYMYLKLGAWSQVALLLQADLAKIGIHLTLQGIDNIDALYTEQGIDANGACVAQTSFGGGPFPMGQEFYTSDYISPDDWTQNNAISYGSANMCMAGYANTTMDNLVIQAAGESNSTTLDQLYGQMTQLMYDNYTVAWLVIPNQFQIVSTQLHGYASNAMGAALPFVIAQNTMYAG